MVSGLKRLSYPIGKVIEYRIKVNIEIIKLIFNTKEFGNRKRYSKWKNKNIIKEKQYKEDFKWTNQNNTQSQISKSPNYIVS